MFFIARIFHLPFSQFYGSWVTETKNMQNWGKEGNVATITITANVY